MGEAARNLTAAIRDPNLAIYALLTLLFLSVQAQTASVRLREGVLKEPSFYRDRLLKDFGQDKEFQVELNMAKAYVDLNTPGSVSVGVYSTNQIIAGSPRRVEPYLMLATHFRKRGEHSEEHKVLRQAVLRAEEFHSYPEK